MRGFLIRQNGPLLVLAQAELLHAGEQTPIDGEFWAERANIAFIQVLES